MYASVDIKPKKPSVHHPKPVKEDDRVEYAAIAFQPKDAAEKSQAAAATAPKTKRYENAGMCVRCVYRIALFTNLLTAFLVPQVINLGRGIKGWPQTQAFCSRFCFAALEKNWKESLEGFHM